MKNHVRECRDYREKMNKKILASGNLTIKRIFNLDAGTYKDGALSARDKELLGLVASMVLRCDDCIKYHLEQCFNHGFSREQIIEVFAIANLVGGTVVIPHTRRAFEFLEELEKSDKI